VQGSRFKVQGSPGLRFHHFYFLLFTFCFSYLSHASLEVFSWNSGFSNGGLVSDNSTNGWVDTRSVTTATPGTIQNLAVNLQLSGGYNGDLYGYLANSTGGFAVLLNHITAAPTQNGMNVTLTPGDWLGANQGSIATYNSASGSVWTPQATPGAWATLTGGVADGSTWTLFLADTAAGDISTVQSWGLQMDIVAVPEVETWVGAALAGAFGALWLHRQVWKGVQKQ
jgi:hypothetical protein